MPKDGREGWKPPGDALLPAVLPQRHGVPAGSAAGPATAAARPVGTVGAPGVPRERGEDVQADRALRLPFRLKQSYSHFRPVYT